MSDPEVSVIIPAYRSHETLAMCLESLQAQTLADFETIVVDSSPDDRGERIVRSRFPNVLFLRHHTRLLPHAARNRGVAHSKGRLLVFTDPDMSFDRRWLENLTRSHRESGDLISGAIDCYGRRWLDSGVHLCKFSKWLPGGEPRATDCAPTGNLLVTRGLYDAIGGFPDKEFLGDVTFSWETRKRGEQLRFEPAAIVFHHHIHTLRSSLKERFERGALFAALRTRWHGGQRRTALFYLTVSVLPIRFCRIMLLVAGQAARAGWLGRYLATFPIVAAGYAASLAGESLGYVRFLLERRRRPNREPAIFPVMDRQRPQALKESAGKR
jgi:GT2 family glycosyltransferase